VVRCKQNWRKGKYREKFLCEVKDSAPCVLVDDNWLCASLFEDKLHFFNMNTNENIADFQLHYHRTRWVRSQFFVIESPSVDPPLVADYSIAGTLHYGRPGSDSIVEVFQLPKTSGASTIAYAQSSDRVVVSESAYKILRFH
jgi:hypothetical protein